MRVVDRDGDTYYLRCWGDHYRYSLVVAPAPQPALTNMVWRTSSAAALNDAVRRIEAAGTTGRWSEAGPARGRAYTFEGWGTR